MMLMIGAAPLCRTTSTGPTCSWTRRGRAAVVVVVVELPAERGPLPHLLVQEEEEVVAVVVVDEAAEAAEAVAVVEVQKLTGITGANELEEKEKFGAAAGEVP
jgi:hypothetical protein